MVKDRMIDLAPNGSTNGTKEEKLPSDSKKRMDLIRDMIENENSSLSDISRRIAIEIAYVSAEIADSVGNPERVYNIKALSEQVKSLRELSKTLIEGDQLSKRDSLNFDGPKFQFVYSKLLEYFKKSIIKAGMKENQANEIMKNFRDLVSMNEELLRKETQKVDRGK